MTDLPADPPWTSFETATFGPKGDALYRENDPGFIGVFLNSRYQVIAREQQTPMGPVTWLAIVRRDRMPIHDWRDMQRIKNELTHPEAEGVELYPAESRLVDTSNQFHIFVLPRGLSFPFGYADRDVSDQKLPGSLHGQRPFEHPPPDLNANTANRDQYLAWHRARKE